MWYLEPIRQKSFYGKAMVDCDYRHYYLFSYGKCVCSCTIDGLNFQRHWSDWSATTARHINVFRERYAHLPPIYKAAWLALPIV